MHCQALVPGYWEATCNAAAARSRQKAQRFGLSAADREDLYQDLVVELLERAHYYDSAKGSLGTFTGRVAENHANDFLNRLKKERERRCFFTGPEAANDPDYPPSAAADEAADPGCFSQDDDLFSASLTLHDLAQALAYMTIDQREFYALLDTHQDLPAACRASGLATATFYRRVNDLQLHLRMFGFKAAA